jgi:hypothetical protein
VKGLTIMVNSSFSGWRMENVWLDKSHPRASAPLRAHSVLGLDVVAFEHCNFALERNKRASKDAVAGLPNPHP